MASEVYLEQVARDADEAFWHVVAARFPGITSGDFDPLAANRRLEQNMTDIDEWLTGNSRIEHSCVKCWLEQHGWGDAGYMDSGQEQADECRRLRQDAPCALHYPFAA